MAPVRTSDGRVIFVPVLDLTGPALVERALLKYAQRNHHIEAGGSTEAGGHAGGGGGGGGRGGERGGVAGRGWSSLRDVRVAFGERGDDPETWEEVSVIGGGGGGGGGSGAVVVLPYCFFRSRGCGHLSRPGSVWDDRVLFHQILYCNHDL